MAGSTSGIRVDYDDSHVQAALEKLFKTVKNTRPVMAEIAEYLHGRTREHFDNQQDPDGNAWAPLADSTLERKQAQGVPINKILHGQTLHLRDTIFPFFGNDEAGVSTGPGTDAYAATQMFGDESRNIEARPFMGLGEEDEREVLAIIEDELLSAL
ncbi:phage virion morphogenesis protein [Nitrincola iocasae]|uniref:Phage virion morphogenesis protein n=1 Tax=Nitrincola iocasae TaxID=2614693 RepID=A0A5J6LAL1_9GAMM|nr:phage virion morphogenesis protein [Nitrincola iocasae]QEW05649.1 phage virion morphogenesis protein [Nitrincola iocasae]